MPRLVAILFAFSLALSVRAYAATFVVTSAADSHDPIPGDGLCGDPSLPDSLRCTFRAAIEEANAHADPDTILFEPSLAVIELSLGTLTISRSGTVIDGRTSGAVIDGLMDPSYTSLMVLTSDSNTVRGVIIRRSRFHGLVVRGSNNCIGDSSGLTQTVFVSNGIDRTSAAAIYIEGVGATHNRVVACRIGYGRNGDLLPNENGIAIDSSASGNTIGGATAQGRNYICGNTRYGVIIGHGAANNLVHNCSVGPDASGLLGFGNGLGGVLLDSGASQNRVGGLTAGDRNFIARNGGPGVMLRGLGTSLNAIAGNVIGLDRTGEIGIGNQFGLLICDAATANTIGGLNSGDRNFITGNDGDGISITGNGTYDNRIIGNFVGTDTSGYSPIGNGWVSGHGIFIGQGAGKTIIGSTADSGANVISGNPHAGICLSGTSGNSIVGNLIGVSTGSVSSAPNGVGVLIEKGASQNIIGGAAPREGNTLSGNRAEYFPHGAGVAIYDPGSDFNQIIGNKIGTDITGSRSLRNGSCGVIIGNGAQHNMIGGSSPGARNVISGNGDGSISISLGAGVHLFGEGTAYNQVSGNYVGVGSNGQTRILNLGNGVGIFGGAAHNVIGGASPSDGNLVSRNPLHGILEDDAGTVSNSFLNNLIYANDSLGIAIRVPGNSIPTPPLLLSATSSVVNGAQAPPLGQIQIYKAAPDPSGSGEGLLVIGNGLADSSGSFAVPISGISSGDTITAVATDSNGSSSAFARNLILDAPTAVNVQPDELPKQFALEQNFPNPFNPSTVIRFSLPRPSRVQLTIINALGEQVWELANHDFAAGQHQMTWNGLDRHGRQVASGVYFYSLQAGELTATRKMLLLK